MLSEMVKDTMNYLTQGTDWFKDTLEDANEVLQTINDRMNLITTDGLAQKADWFRSKVISVNETINHFEQDMIKGAVDGLAQGVDWFTDKLVDVDEMINIINDKTITIRTDSTQVTKLADEILRLRESMAGLEDYKLPTVQGGDSGGDTSGKQAS